MNVLPPSRQSVPRALVLALSGFILCPPLAQACTRWRTVVDHQRKLYFFESALTPNTFWVDLQKIDFASASGQVKKLDLGKDQSTTYSGAVSSEFKVAPPFRFEGA